jgi:hypothetical protein
MHNEGFIQSGGTTTATNIAIGRNAAIHQDQQGDSEAMVEVRRQLEALLKELNQHGNAIQNSDEVKGSVQLIQNEIAKEKPNRLTLGSVLSGIADSVKSVSTIATTVEALKIALAALFA